MRTLIIVVFVVAAGMGIVLAQSGVPTESAAPEVTLELGVEGYFRTMKLTVSPWGGENEKYYVVPAGTDKEASNVTVVVTNRHRFTEASLTGFPNRVRGPIWVDTAYLKAHIDGAGLLVMRLRDGAVASDVKVEPLKNAAGGGIGLKLSFRTLSREQLVAQLEKMTKDYLELYLMAKGAYETEKTLLDLQKRQQAVSKGLLEHAKRLEEQLRAAGITPVETPTTP